MSSVRVSVHYEGKCISCSLARKEKRELVFHLHRNGVAIALIYERHSKYKMKFFLMFGYIYTNCEEASFSSQNLGSEPLEAGCRMTLGSAGSAMARWAQTGSQQVCAARKSSALVPSSVIWDVA